VLVLGFEFWVAGLGVISRHLKPETLNSKLVTLPLGKPAPDQLHLEAVASVGRFDQLTPGEQVEGVIQFIEER
jgi:hypothetical protein